MIIIIIIIIIMHIEHRHKLFSLVHTCFRNNTSHQLIRHSPHATIFCTSCTVSSFYRSFPRKQGSKSPLSLSVYTPKNQIFKAYSDISCAVSQLTQKNMYSIFFLTLVSATLLNTGVCFGRCKVSFICGICDDGRSKIGIYKRIAQSTISQPI
jgi:hypothetical protein